MLVPPSALMVIYGVWTETSIGDLFVAGIIPCVILTLAYCLVLMAWCRLQARARTARPRIPGASDLASLAKLLPALAIIGVVLGGIYGGVMTPSESAARRRRRRAR